MPETVRSYAQLIALLHSRFADISAENIRDLVASVFPQTTVGDLPGFDGTLIGRLAPSTDGFVLTLDSGETYGFKWAAAGGHVEDHDHDGAPTQKLLAANTHETPSTDTHHAKSHAHDAVDGSGTVAHADTTGKTANDHHNQSHGNADHTTAFTDDTVANAHIADTGDAHDASAISILDTAADFTADNVEDALAELQADNEAHVAAADPHTGYVLESLLDALGDLYYASADNTPAKLAGNITTSRKFLRQTGDGAVSAAPAWDTVLAADVVATAMKATLSVSAAAMSIPSGGTASKTVIDSGGSDIGLTVIDFDATAIEYAVFVVDMPENWDGGTVTAKFRWMTSSSTSTHTCRWGLQGRSYGDAETLDQAYGTAIFVDDDATATANQALLSAATAAITLAGTPAAGELVAFRVQRDPTHANDDLNVDARLIAVKLQFGITALSAA